jgi:hypothetical protein
MKRLIKISLLVLISSISNISYSNECKDDPRLHAIGSVIEQINNSNGLKIKPIKMTGNTFFNLTSEARGALRDNILVMDSKCSPYEIYNGRSPIKISVPYQDLSTAIYWALLRNDIETAVQIASSFKADDMSVDNLISLTTELNWSPKAIERAVKAGILVDKNQIGFDSKFCPGQIAKKTNIELFAKLNGKAIPIKKIENEDGETLDNYVRWSVGNFKNEVEIYIKGKTNSSTESSMVKYKRNKETRPCSGISISGIKGALAKIGIKLKDV